MGECADYQINQMQSGRYHSSYVKTPKRKESNMANFNKILLVGNLTRDPQLSYLPSQTPVCEFGLVVNRTWTGKDGAKKEETCFVECKAFAKMAETLNKYLEKGKSVLIEGRLKFDSWTAKDGSKRSKHSVIVETFQFLGSKSGADKQTPVKPPQTYDTPPESQMDYDDVPF